MKTQKLNRSYFVFIRYFFRRHRIDFTQFLKYTKKRYGDKIQNLVNNLERQPDAFIDYCIWWCETPEPAMFWQEVHYKFQVEFHAFQKHHNIRLITKTHNNNDTERTYNAFND